MFYIFFGKCIDAKLLLIHVSFLYDKFGRLNFKMWAHMEANRRPYYNCTMTRDFLICLCQNWCKSVRVWYQSRSRWKSYIIEPFWRLIRELCIQTMQILIVYTKLETSIDEEWLLIPVSFLLNPFGRLNFKMWVHMEAI